MCCEYEEMVCECCRIKKGEDRSYRGGLRTFIRFTIVGIFERLADVTATRPSLLHHDMLAATWSARDLGALSSALLAWFHATQFPWLSTRVKLLKLNSSPRDGALPATSAQCSCTYASRSTMLPVVLGSQIAELSDEEGR